MACGQSSDRNIHFEILWITYCFCQRVNWFLAGATWVNLPQDFDLIQAETNGSPSLMLLESHFSLFSAFSVPLQSSPPLALLSSCWRTALKSRESACWSDSPITNEKRHGSDSKINEVSSAALACGTLGLFLQGCRRCLTAIYGDK